MLAPSRPLDIRSCGSSPQGRATHPAVTRTTRAAAAAAAAAARPTTSRTMPDNPVTEALGDLRMSTPLTEFLRVGRPDAARARAGRPPVRVRPVLAATAASATRLVGRLHPPDAPRIWLAGESVRDCIDDAVRPGLVDVVGEADTLQRQVQPPPRREVEVRNVCERTPVGLTRG